MAHIEPYASSEKQKRFNEAVGPNKMFGTGSAVIRAFRLMAKGTSVATEHRDIAELLDILQEGIAVALEESFKLDD
jgi:hypothetical protein